MKKIITGVIFIIMLCSTFAFAAELPSHPNIEGYTKEKYDPNGDGVVRFSENGKEGCKDLDGNIIIKPEWDQLSWEHNTQGIQTFVAGMKKDGLWGLMDKQGQLICEPKWKDVLINKEVIRVLDTNDKYGYLDGYGNMLIEPRYDFAEPAFENGLALIGRDFGYTFIDKEGKEIMPLQSYMLYQAHTIADCFYYFNNGKMVVIDRSGNILIGEKYEHISFYDNEFLIVSANGMNGVVTLRDEMIIPLEYDELIRCRKEDGGDGITFYGRKQETIFLLNLDGTVISEFEADIIQDYYGSDILVVRKNYKYGLLNKYGAAITEPIYEQVYFYSPSQKYIYVQHEGLMGILKSDGTYLVEPRWNIDVSEIQYVDGDYFIFSKNNKYGLLDKNGNLIIEPMFEHIRWIDGKLIMEEGHEWYSIELVDNPQIMNDDILIAKAPTPEADYLFEQGILKGDENGDLKLWDTFTRAEFVSMLQRVEKWEMESGDCKFDDVQNHWAKDAITTATSKGIIKGYDDTNFKPDELITNRQAMTILLRMIGFTDDDLVDSHTSGLVYLIHDMKIFPNGSIIYNDPATRDAVAVMLYKYIYTDMTVEKVKGLPPKTITYLD